MNKDPKLGCAPLEMVRNAIVSEIKCPYCGEVLLVRVEPRYENYEDHYNFVSYTGEPLNSSELAFLKAQAKAQAKQIERELLEKSVFDAIRNHKCEAKDE